MPGTGTNSVLFNNKKLLPAHVVGRCAISCAQVLYYEHNLHLHGFFVNAKE